MDKKIILHVEGLDCEDELKLIRSAIEGLKGISSFEANIMTRTMKAGYDDKLVSEQDIIRAISGTGLKARKKEEVRKGSVWWKEPRILTLSACGLFILFAFAFEHVFGISHRSASVLYGIATLIGGYYPAKMGLAALKTLRPNIRTLMVAGAIGAMGLGLWEEAALLVLIYSLGDVL